MLSTKNLTSAALAPLLYLLFCTGLAAAIAYPLFVLIGGDIGFFRTLVSRGGLVFLILGLYPLAKYLKLAAADIGFRRLALLRQLVLGFILGMLILALHMLALLVLKIRAIDPHALRSIGHVSSILAQSLAIGAAVALIEETVFRGVLLAGLRRFSGAAPAVAISAFYYAALHFLRSNWTADIATVGWDTGFRIAADAFGHMAAMPLGAFLALFLAGILLACVRIAFPHGLGYCIGLHAGWVFVIKSGKAVTDAVPGASGTFLVSGYDGITSYLAAGWIGFLSLLFVLAFRHHFVRQRDVSGTMPSR